MDLARMPSDGALLEPPGDSIGYCPYCGSPLSPQYYFCTACSTPYKHPETVLPSVRAPYLTDGMLIERKAPSAMPVFWTYFSVVIASAVISSIAFDEKNVNARMITGTIAIGLTTCIVAAIYWRSLAVQLTRFGFFSPAAWIGLAALVPLLALNYGYHIVFLRWAGATVEPLGDPSWSHAELIAIICILPAITEELAFRGLLQHWLQAALTPTRALVIASALFAGLHFSVLSLPYLFLVGMLLGWTKLKTQSLYPSMLIHFLHNLVAIEFLSTIHGFGFIHLPVWEMDRGMFLTNAWEHACRYFLSA